MYVSRYVSIVRALTEHPIFFVHFYVDRPGGQYTNLLFQSSQLGLTGQWAQIKKAYAQANRLLGDIPKVGDGGKKKFLAINTLIDDFLSFFLTHTGDPFIQGSG